MFKGRAVGFAVWPLEDRPGYGIRITWMSGRATTIGRFDSIDAAEAWIARESETWVWLQRSAAAAAA